MTVGVGQVPREISRVGTNLWPRDGRVVVAGDVNPAHKVERGKNEELAKGSLVGITTIVWRRHAQVSITNRGRRSAARQRKGIPKARRGTAVRQLVNRENAIVRPFQGVSQTLDPTSSVVTYSRSSGIKIVLVQKGGGRDLADVPSGKQRNRPTPRRARGEKSRNSLKKTFWM